MQARTSHGTPKKEFWDKKARTFPRFEEGENNYEAGMLNRVREHGVDFKNSTVLDVGCGSGMYTIRIAREAERVTALDISDAMLDVLREDAGTQGLDNIEYVRSEWMDFDSDATYDIVFCSMTPAIRDEESRLKLLGHAGRWTVFMGFDGVMNSRIMSGLYDHYGVAPKVLVNGTEMRRWLDGRNIPYTRIEVEGHLGGLQKPGGEDGFGHHVPQRVRRDRRPGPPQGIPGAIRRGTRHVRGPDRVQDRSADLGETGGSVSDRKPRSLKRERPPYGGLDISRCK